MELTLEINEHSQYILRSMDNKDCDLHIQKIMWPKEMFPKESTEFWSC